jgi:itaconate CoA-transferase
LNRSKESVALDLKNESAREILEQLLGQADVFIHNLTPDGAARLGIGGQEVLDRHRSLVTCTISGFGAGGPLADRKAYDLIIQAEAGMLEVTGTPDHPSKVGVSIADIASGMYAHSGILAALFRRARTGEGSFVPVVMLEALVEWMSAPLYFSHYGGNPPPRTGSRHATIAPYGPFSTKDGKTVFIGVQNEREWNRFCRDVLDDEPLSTDALFVDNSARVSNVVALTELIQARMGQLATETVTERLEAAGIAHGDVNDLESVWNHRQLRARDRFMEVTTETGPVTMLRPPGHTDTRGRSENEVVPSLGQHTDAVLSSLGVTEAARADLRASGAIR